MKKTILSILFVSSIIGLNAFAAPNTPETPLEIVQGLYKPYLDDPHAEKTDTPDSVSLILPHASTSLKTALEKSQSCQAEDDGICGIDFDIIINAQDWDISDFKLKEIALKPDDARTTKPAIDATFINGEKNLVRYIFMQEQGEWKIADIEATRFDKAGKVEHWNSLTSLLNSLNNPSK